MVKRISDLPAASAITGSDEFEINQGGSSRRATRAQIVSNLAPATHTHAIADLSDGGALAGKDSVASADLDAGAVTLAKLAPGTPDALLGFDGSGSAAEVVTGQGLDVTGMVITADVVSVFGRTGPVSAQAGDYDGLPLDLQDAALIRPEIRDYSETSNLPVITAGALTLDLEVANAFDVVLTEDVTSISVVNAPASGKLGTVTVRFRQDAIGGRSVDLSAFDWGVAGAPAVPATPTAGRLWIAALTLDGGVSWEAVTAFERS